MKAIQYINKTNRGLSLRKHFSFILVIIILKPIIDFTWKLNISNTFQAANINQIVSFILPMILISSIITKLGLHRKVIFIYSFPTVAILFLSLVAILHSYNIFTIEETMRNISIFLIYILGLNLINNDEVFYKYISWIVLVSILPTLVGYLQLMNIVPYTYWDRLGEGYNIVISRVSGGYLHPTQYLGYIIICLPCILFMYANKKISSVKCLLWITLTLPIVIATFHRTAIIIILLQLLLFLILWKRKLVKWIMIIGTISFIIVYWGSIYNIFTGERGINSILTFRGRTFYWSIYMNSFWDGNIVNKLIGNGNSYSQLLGFADTHSDYLKFLYKYGIIGLLLFISFIYEIVEKILTKMIKCYKARKNELTSSKYYLGLIIVLSWLIYSTTTTPLHSTSFGWNFALIIAYICNSNYSLATQKSNNWRRSY